MAQRQADVFPVHRTPGRSSFLCLSQESSQPKSLG